ncbi:putative ribonuclease H-like domain-containing protein [Tanacetum coccineum]
MCDKKNSVLFTDTGCFVLSPDFKLADESQVLLKVPRKNNMYSVDMKNIVPKESLTCLVAKATLDESMLWHRRLGHVNFKTINKLVKENLVRGLPSKHFENDQTCVACLKGKQHKASCNSKIQNSITHPLFMLHMDLFGPTFMSSVMNKKYCLVVTDDYSRFTWVFFLATKDETSGILKSFITEIENLVDKKKGIKREYSVARTPQQNGVAKRRNKTLIEAARTIIGCHVTILNTLDHLGKFDGKPVDGFFVGYSLNSKAFRVYNIRTKKVEENLHISDTRKKDDEGVSKESGMDDQERRENNTQDDNDAGPSINTKLDIFSLGDNATLEAIHADLFGDETEMDISNITTTYPVPSTLNKRINKDHSLDHVIANIQSGVQTRGISKTTNEQGFISAVYDGKAHEDLHTCLFVYFLYQEEPKRIAKALSDPAWVEAMQEELLQFKLQKVWILVDLPKGKRAIGTQWIFRNRKDERGIVIRNEARLVTQGYTQEEGIDYDEVIALIARIEAIRLFSAYVSFMGFMVYQMDVKSAFLYGQIEEEVYVCQPPGFEDPDYLDKVYKVVKVLYGLHKAPRAWYETLAKYLLDNGFHRGKIDQTLFIKKQKGDILLVQFYIDDIIFGSTKKELWLQVKQKEDRIFISQDKYVAKILRKFNFTDVRTASTPMDIDKPLLKDSNGDDVNVHLYRLMIGSLMYLTSSRPDIMFAACACARFQVTPKVSHSHAMKRIFRYLKGQPKLGLWYPRDSPFDLVAYFDSDYAGASLDMKSTIGGCQFLGYKLISWQCKKQTLVATSSTEAEYVAAASCCRQVL